MGTGLTFKTAKEALTAEFKKAGTIDNFLGTVLPIPEEITGTTIQFNVDDIEE